MIPATSLSSLSLLFSFFTLKPFRQHRVARQLGTPASTNIRRKFLREGVQHVEEGRLGKLAPFASGGKTHLLTPPPTPKWFGRNERWKREVDIAVSTSRLDQPFLAPGGYVGGGVLRRRMAQASPTVILLLFECLILDVV